MAKKKSQPNIEKNKNDMIIHVKTDILSIRKPMPPSTKKFKNKKKETNKKWC